MSKVAKAAVNGSLEFIKTMDIMECTPGQLKEILKFNILMDQPVGIWGIAGIGKTEITGQVCDELDMDLVVLHLQHMEVEDLKGFPFPDPADPTAVTMRLMKRLPREKSKRKGTILFLDEWNRADRSVVNAIFTLMEKPRRVGDYVLPDDVRIVLAGNPSDGNYSVNEAEKEPAIRRRVNWIGLSINQAAVLEYAARNKWHTGVINYLKRHKDEIYDYEGHAAGRVSASPATWDKVSRALNHAAQNGGLEKNRGALRYILAGYLGKKVSTKLFQEVTSEDGELITPDEILAGFDEGTEVYEKVVKLANGNAGAHGKLTSLASSLALTVITEARPPVSITSQIAAFCKLLPGDTFQRFQQEIVDGLGDESNPDKKKYLASFSVALSKEPAYREAREIHSKKARQVDSFAKGK